MPVKFGLGLFSVVGCFCCYCFKVLTVLNSLWIEGLLELHNRNGTRLSDTFLYPTLTTIEMAPDCQTRFCIPLFTPMLADACSKWRKPSILSTRRSLTACPPPTSLTWPRTSSSCRILYASASFQPMLAPTWWCRWRSLGRAQWPGPSCWPMM